MKKLLLVFVLSFICSCPLSGFENLAPNPRFLEGSEDAHAPAGWEYRQNFVSPASAGRAYPGWEKEGYNGARSIKIAEERWFSSSQWGARAGGIEPDKYYLFSLRTKRDSATGWLPKLRIFGQSRVINVKRPGEFLYYEFLINSKNTRGETELALIVHDKPSVIWFSDLMLVKFEILPSSPPDNAMVEAGDVEFSWELPENNQALTFTYSLFEKNGDDELFFLENIPDASLTLSFNGEGEYSWRVAAYSGAVEVARSSLSFFSVKCSGKNENETKHPAVYLKPENAPDTREARIDNRGLFPVGVNALPPDYISWAKDSGVNWVFMPSDEEKFSKAGMNIIGRPGSDFANIFYLYDEPDQGGVLPADVRARHKSARNFKATVPSAVTVYDPDRYMEYAGVSDILMVDPYPVPVRPLGSVAEAVAEACEAKGGSVWAILQAFNWADASAEARREGIGRLPTGDELRQMAFMAIAAGAEGIVFYTIIRNDTRREDIYPAIAEIASEIRKIDLFLNLPGGESYKDGPLYILKKKLPGAGEWTLAVNSSSEPAEFQNEIIRPYGVFYDNDNASFK
jgi:hypothetical protein